MDKGKTFVIVLVFLLILILTPTTWANGGPFVTSGTVNGNIMFIDEPRVEVISEDLWLDVGAEKYSFIHNPMVTMDIFVKYYLRNNSQEIITLPIAFPQEGESENWLVKINGKEIVLDERVELTGSLPPEAQVKFEWINTRTGKKETAEYWNWNSIPIYNLFAQTFRVSLVPGENMLEVNYQARPAYNKRIGLNPTYRFIYLLAPASNWNSFKDLNVTLNIPFQHFLHSSLPLNKVSSSTWQGNFSSLPNENLYLYFTASAGTWGGLADSPLYSFLFLMFFLILYKFLIRKTFNKISKITYMLYYIILSASVLWINYITFSREIISYPFTFFQYFLYWGIVSWVILICWRKYKYFVR
ncbi:MAG: hypothetical protein ACOYVD_16995 [Bacillota bacterium]